MIRLYADECVHGQIIRGLRDHGIDVLTVVDDRREGDPDPAVLARAGELGRVLLTQDDDLLAIAVRLQRSGDPFPGVIYAPQGLSVGTCIADLVLMASVAEPEELAERLEFLPL